MSRTRSAALAVLLLSIALTTGATALVLGGETSEGGGSDIAVSDGVAYICGPGIFDASNPAAGYLPLAHTLDCTSIEVRGSIAYTVGADGLRLLDVSDPAHPTQLGVLPLPAPGLAIAMVGHLAYIATNTPGIQIIDVSTRRLRLRSGRSASPGRRPLSSRRSPSRTAPSI